MNKLRFYTAVAFSLLLCFKLFVFRALLIPREDLILGFRLSICKLFKIPKSRNSFLGKVLGLELVTLIITSSFSGISNNLGPFSSWQLYRLASFKNANSNWTLLKVFSLVTKMIGIVKTFIFDFGN